MTYHARIAGTDDVVFPADLARELGIEDGDSLVVEREGSGLVIKSYRQVVREVQAAFRAMLPPADTRSMVDELIAERRAEAARDAADERSVAP